MKQILTLILALVALIASIAGFIYLNQSVADGLTTAATNEEKAATIDKRDSIARTQSAFLDGTATERTQLAQFIAHDSDIVHVIETIEAAGRREKVLVTIGSVVVTQMAGWKQHEIVKIEMSGKGTFASLTAFATALELFPVASRVDSVSMEPSGKGLWFGTFGISLVKEKAQ